MRFCLARHTFHAWYVHVLGLRYVLGVRYVLGWAGCSVGNALVRSSLVVSSTEVESCLALRWRADAISGKMVGEWQGNEVRRSFYALPLLLVEGGKGTVMTVLSVGSLQ